MQVSSITQMQNFHFVEPHKEDNQVVPWSSHFFHTIFYIKVDFLIATCFSIGIE
jgi:hypothetical protein